jgi:hypothetical protein
VRATVFSVVLPGVLLGSYAVGSALVPAQMEFAGPSQSKVEQPGATVTDLVVEHGCWTGEAPVDMQGQLPGHVVVTKRGAEAPVYGGSRLTGMALEQIFDGEPYGLTVHAFCR